MPKSLNGQSGAKYDGDYLRAHQRDEGEERTYISPHHRYHEEKFSRRRSTRRVSYLFIAFGFSLSALIVLVLIMLLSITTTVSL